MVEPIENFSSWFDVTGAWHQDPATGEIVVTKGWCIMKKPADQMPYKFQSVSSTLNLAAGHLKSLEGCPQKVPGDFALGSYKGENFVGGPAIVKGNYTLSANPYLESLDGLASEIGEKLVLRYDPRLPLLRALVAKKGIGMYAPEDGSSQMVAQLHKVEKILNKYKGQGTMAIFDCQKDLEDAGFEAHARW